jgi:hypothetical protein
MNGSSHSELFRSCEILFGSELRVSGEFLDYLEISGVKSAFRRRAMETHPDRLAGRDVLLQRETTAHFCTVRAAYENLLGFLREKDSVKGATRSGRPAPPGENRSPTGGHVFSKRQHQDPPQGKPIRPIILGEEGYGGVRFANTESYYRGSLPHRRLLFGHFLYYSGLANWRTIARVLTWQRTERPRLGELGRRLGMFDQDDISTILHSKSPGISFGQTAQMLGMLSEQQLRVLIFQQQRLQKKFGTILLEKNLLKDYELRELLDRFEQHNRSTTIQGRR